MVDSVTDPWAGFEDADPSAQAADPWSGFEDATPDAGDKLKAVGQGAVGGLQEGSMATMGAVAGGKLGAPLGPFGIVAGATLGGVGGFLAGRIMRQNTIGDIEDVAPELRPYAVGGETFGSALPFAAAPVALGRMGARVAEQGVGRWINKILRTAAKNPKAFLASEVSAAGSAAMAGGLAENYDPGDGVTRFVAEATAGMANPARFITAAAQGSYHRVSKTLGAMSQAGRETQSAAILRGIVKEAGEDPEMLAALLRDSDLPGANLTAAQKTGSQALGAVEAFLSKQNARFGVEAEKQMRDGLQSMEGMISALRGTGDPQALRLAAQERQRSFAVMLKGIVDGAENDAIQAAARISKDPASAASAISTQARESLETVLSEARRAERDLWGRIPRDSVADSTNLLNEYQSLTADMLPGEELPRVVTETMKALGQADGATDLGFLLRVRSRMLAFAREAASRNEWSDARLYGRMAEAALDDMGSVRPAAEFAEPNNGPSLAKMLSDLTKKSTRQKPKGIIEYVRSLGPALDEGGELSSRGLTYAGRMQGRVGKKAMSLDDIALRATEAGYFPGMERASIDDLLKAIDEELAGTPQYSGKDLNDLGYQESLDDLDQMLGELGIDAQTATPQQVRAALDAASKAGNDTGDLGRRLADMLDEADADGLLDAATPRTLEDLASEPLLGNAAPVGRVPPPQAVDDARAFSRALNQVFSSSFAGRALQVGRQGNQRVPAELMMRRALAAGGEAAELQFRELDEAARFLAREGMQSPAAEEAASAMLDAQERFLRLTASNAIDPATGKVSTKKLQSMLRTNEALFERFPQARTAVQNAIVSQDKLAQIERMAGRADRVTQQAAAFAKIAKAENPADVIRKAVNSDNPVQQLSQIAKLAKRGGKQALDGLKAATIDFIITRGQSDPARIRSQLFDTIGAGKQSVADVMVQAKVLSPDDLTRITTILDAADRVVASTSARADLMALADGTDALTDFMLRIQGSRLGSMISRPGGPASGNELVAAGAGSRFLRTMFEKMDIATTQKVLIEAAKDPEFMAMLLTKPVEPIEAFELGRQIHGYLLSAGYRFAAEGNENDAN